MSQPDIILASGSRFRRSMLEAAGVSLRTIPSTVDEPELRRSLEENNPGIEPAEVAGHLAIAKALSVSRLHIGSVVIGADQVLECAGRIYAKPRDCDEARKQMIALRNTAHTLPTACVLARDGETLWTHIERPRLTMRNFSDSFLEKYLEAMGETVTETVGGYKLEGLGAQLFERIEGDYFAIIGLQLLPLLAELRRLNILPG